MRTWQWYGLWLLLFLNTTAGIAIISQAAPMVQEITNVDAAQAASLVGIISIANGAGRLLWAWLSDAIGRRTVFLIMFPLQAAIFAVLPSVHEFLRRSRRSRLSCCSATAADSARCRPWPPTTSAPTTSDRSTG